MVASNIANNATFDKIFVTAFLTLTFFELKNIELDNIIGTFSKNR